MESRGARLHSIPGTVPALLALPPGCTFAPRCERRTEQCQLAVPPLATRARQEFRCIHPL